MGKVLVRPPCLLPLPLAITPNAVTSDSITMGIRAMQWEEWFQPDCRWLHYHAIKVDRMARQGDSVVRIQPPKEEEGVKVPGGELAGVLFAFL